MNIISGSNAFYSSADLQSIDITLVTDTLGTVPCTVHPNDPPTAQIYADCISGKYGAIAAYVAPPMPENPAAFEQAVKVSLGGIIPANQLMTVYPAFFPAIQTSQWADVSALLADALSKNVITSAQNTAIKTAALSNGITL